jgi:hypothetical protein
MRTMTLGLVGILAISASATTIVSEDFESYADTAALGGVWSLGDGTLDTTLGNGGNSMAHPGTGGSFTGGNTNSLSFAPVLPGPGEVLIYSADIYDDGTSANKRVSAGLRTAAGANLIEMGMYNGPTHYAVRTILFASGGSNWVAFDNIVDDLGDPISNSPVEGWHTYTVEITDTQATFTLDLNGDGNINATRVEAVTASAGFDIIRLGGPSDVSSLGGGANFDNISLELVPEPSALVLLCLGGVALARRR